MSNTDAAAPTPVPRPTPAAESTSSSATPPVHSSTTTSPASEPTATHASHVYGLLRAEISALTQAPEETCSMLTFWVLSTWFAFVLPIAPCLVISGPVHHGLQLLRVLARLCGSPRLLSGFRKSDLRAVGARTLLIFQPNLSRELAAFLGSLGCQDFTVVNGRDPVPCGRPVAVFVGEDTSFDHVLFSIRIDIGNLEKFSAPGVDLCDRAKPLSDQIQKYRDLYHLHVKQRLFHPVGLSPEMTEVARSLGSCIVGDADLQNMIVPLLGANDGRWPSDRGDTIDAVVVEATISLIRKQPPHLFARDIAIEANRLLELRGETLRLSPEKVGHRLRRLGLPTRRLNQSGNGLLLDRATIASIEQLADMYVGEDCAEVPSSPEVTEESEVKQVM